MKNNYWKNDTQWIGRMYAKALEKTTFKDLKWERDDTWIVNIKHNNVQINF